MTSTRDTLVPLHRPPAKTGGKGTAMPARVGPLATEAGDAFADARRAAGAGRPCTSVVEANFCRPCNDWSPEGSYVAGHCLRCYAPDRRPRTDPQPSE